MYEDLNSICALVKSTLRKESGIYFNNFHTPILARKAVFFYRKNIYNRNKALSFILTTDNYNNINANYIVSIPKNL